MSVWIQGINSYIFSIEKLSKELIAYNHINCFSRYFLCFVSSCSILALLIKHLLRICFDTLKCSKHWISYSCTGHKRAKAFLT